MKSATLRGRSEGSPNARGCPNCGVTLEWTERGVLAGVEYDYYKWCPNGCGLFCYDRHARHFLKLA
jgi:hypothetical protein